MTGDTRRCFSDMFASWLPLLHAPTYFGEKNTFPRFPCRIDDSFLALLARCTWAANGGVRKVITGGHRRRGFLVDRVTPGVIFLCLTRCTCLIALNLLRHRSYVVVSPAGGSPSLFGWLVPDDGGCCLVTESACVNFPFHLPLGSGLAVERRPPATRTILL